MDNKIGTRKEKELDDIKNQILEMFDQIIKMTEISIIMFENNSSELALDLIDEDLNLDQQQNDLIVSVNYFILREQPKAIDLRVALAAHTISYDLERIGDYFKNFAKMSLKAEVDDEQKKLIISLVNLISGKIKELKDIYMNVDHKGAKKLAKEDIEIDNLSAMLVSEAVDTLRTSLEEKEAKDLTRIIVLAKAFERAGDHIVNVCEHISYVNKGQIYHYS